MAGFVAVLLQPQAGCEVYPQDFAAASGSEVTARATIAMSIDAAESVIIAFRERFIG